jgi:hypothetical protein
MKTATFLAEDKLALTGGGPERQVKPPVRKRVRDKEPEGIPRRNEVGEGKDNDRKRARTTEGRVK